MTSAPRVERVDDLVVDSQGLDPPTDKWLQAAREAADTDGIRENAYAERLQMCISCCTLMCMFPMVPNMYRVSHSRYVSERVSPSYSTTGIGPFYKNMESLPVAPVPPEALPRHSRGTPYRRARTPLRPSTSLPYQLDPRPPFCDTTTFSHPLRPTLMTYVRRTHSQTLNLTLSYHLYISPTTRDQQP